MRDTPGGRRGAPRTARLLTAGLEPRAGEGEERSGEGAGRRRGPTPGLGPRGGHSCNRGATAHRAAQAQWRRAA